MAIERRTLWHHDKAFAPVVCDDLVQMATSLQCLFRPTTSSFIPCIPLFSHYPYTERPCMFMIISIVVCVLYVDVRHESSPYFNAIHPSIHLSVSSPLASRHVWHRLHFRFNRIEVEVLLSFARHTHHTHILSHCSTSSHLKAHSASKTSCVRREVLVLQWCLLPDLFPHQREELELGFSLVKELLVLGSLFSSWNNLSKLQLRESIRERCECHYHHHYHHQLPPLLLLLLLLLVVRIIILCLLPSW